MDSKVKVTADQLGNVVVISKNNAEWGYIKVEQARTVFDDDGFVRKKVITALIHGKIDDLISFNWHKNQELEGKIVFKESLEPFNPKEPERDYKIAGETGVNCKSGGQPIYRKHFYTKKANIEDVSVMHDNIAEIRAAYGKTDSNVNVNGPVDDLSQL